MLQPRSKRTLSLTILAILLLLEDVKGLEYLSTSPRRRRQDANDVTTVLLVDNHGRSSFGRFLSVKPDLGLITSTARTFIQEGVTTEYATQVLGTTLDNGRLYAHLLTKSSRVIYDADSPSTKIHDNKKWSLDQKDKQTINLSPSYTEPMLVFPTTKPNPLTQESPPLQVLEEELLKEEPSSNVRVPYQIDNLPLQNNIKIFKINPQIKDVTNDNVIIHKEVDKGKQSILPVPSKVRPWDNLPTFTVRNEFSPSGFSYLGDFPEFDHNTERSRATTASDRKAKLLFRAGLVKPELRDLQTITYSGFADFTTTVGDTVIVFTPHTTEAPINLSPATKITVEPTIEPTTVFKEPTIGTTIKTFFAQEPGMETQTVKGHKIEKVTTLPTMVIDKADRQRIPKQQQEEQREDMEAKSSVLAHEQSGETIETDSVSTLSGTSTIVFTPDAIQPSEQQTLMLSTPSDEDIAKIFASLQAQAKLATEPLNTVSTIFFDESTVNKPSISSGATTIFFEDDPFMQNTALETTLKSTSTITSPLQETTSTTSTSTTSTTTTTTSSTTSTTIESLPETTEKEITTTQKETPTTTTTEKEITTTTADLPETTSGEELISTVPFQETTPELLISNEIDTEKLPELSEVDVSCTEGSQIIPTTVYKTLTYLTTFFIPDEETTSTSIKSNEVVSTEIGFQTISCDINPSTVEQTTIRTSQPTTQADITTTEQDSTEGITEGTTEGTTPILETTSQEITTERRHVTESEPETTELTTESGEEIELIFKTLYTTYTYLTTYFQDTTSSIASKIVVTTNVITSTLVPGSEASDSAVAGLFEREDNLISTYKSKTISFEDFADITPTRINNAIEPTVVDEDVKDLSTATPLLNEAKILQNGIKTYYTTYTYFTTIFVDGETEISSRTEVYTNYVTPTIRPTATLENIVPTQQIVDQLEVPEDEEIISKKTLSLNVTPLNTYNSTISRQKTITPTNQTKEVPTSFITTTVNKEQTYVTLQRGTTTENAIDNNLLSEFETIATMVTDVRSSTSEGDRRIIDNVDKRNVLLDDQIVSESNNDSEIIPSPTLLLQTSYTTFTYFTTMYHGTTSSNIVSRLETITNVVTETLTPTHTLSVEDLNLPITYFTTFTYWTTLYKDGTTKVTSREDTISNVVTPTQTAIPTISITPTSTVNEVKSTEIEPSIQPSKVGDDDLTTYYTTYTYYTTSYVGDSTVLKSRLETVTNVINSTSDVDSNQLGRAVGSTPSRNQIPSENKSTDSTSPTIKPTGLLSTIVNTIENLGTTTILSTDVFGTYIDGLYAKVLESTSSIFTPSISPSSTVVENLKPTGVVSINHGKIVDADGISTLYYTTQAIGTYIDNLYAQVIESTSSLKVNEERKSALATDIPITHRTGLVRLIDGSIVQNATTTLYQSKVLGTVIDGRYAQVIESTSSFLVGKFQSIKPTSVNNIEPTSTQAPDKKIEPTKVPISPSPVVIESSLTDASKIEEETTTVTSEEEENEDGSSRVKSRLTFQTKKRTFTPAIRPFASRPRPTFAPKRKGPGPATTVTRSDVTPTVTAVPASKPARFGGRRSSSSSNISPSASGSRRFSRPKSSSSISATSSFGGARKSSSKIQPTATGFASSRRSAFRSSGSAQRASSLFNNGNSRFRIRPTLSSSLSKSLNTATPASTDSEEDNDLTTQVTDNPTDSTDETTIALGTTTESTSRRSQNPLLRFRRPPLSRPTSGPRTTRRTAKTTKAPITTVKPKSGFTRSNSALRPRTNALFPRRGLFTTTSTTPPPEEEEEEDIEEEGDDIEDEENEDTDYEGSQTNTQTATPPTTPSSRRSRTANVQIKPFRKRNKRQTNYSRFRRPSPRTTSTAAPEPVPETEAPKRRANARYSRVRTTTQGTPPAQTTRKRISPSKASLQGRTQFTLREKDTTPRSTFKRPTTVSRARSSSNLSRSRLRNQYTTETAKSQTTHRKTTANNRRRAHSRQRGESPEIDNYVLPQFDGTITVTHQIPTEVTIPVVNGKITEYKNIITAKYSTEVLGPKQYSTSQNSFGKDVTVLVSEGTSAADNGVTFITQHVLHGTPTTSVVFTPTYIRGRKTSFSHVIPSTAYSVEQVVNTIQPALAAQAPLANILLSQLLLGGIPQQNPLLGLQNPGLPATPTTEFKTRATTYVTTVTSSTSTVIPLTFRGKEILTTIIDSSVNVVTATEFLTDTIVVTPTLPLSNPQLNTLLLPLLQQQLAQPPPNLISSPPSGVLDFAQPQAQALYQEPEKFNLALEEEVDAVANEQVLGAASEATPKRKSSRRKNKKPTVPTPTEPPKQTSVITLYVSGRTPGEFSTVLSTVVVNENRKKRDVVLVKPSIKFDDLVISTHKYFDTYVMPGTKGVDEVTAPTETESLESVVGDVSKYVSIQKTDVLNTKSSSLNSASKKYKIKYIKASEGNQKSSGNFLV